MHVTPYQRDVGPQTEDNLTRPMHVTPYQRDVGPQTEDNITRPMLGTLASQSNTTMLLINVTYILNRRQDSKTTQQHMHIQQYTTHPFINVVYPPDEDKATGLTRLIS